MIESLCASRPSVGIGFLNDLFRRRSHITGPEATSFFFCRRLSLRHQSTRGRSKTPPSDSQSVCDGPHALPFQNL